MSTTEDVRPNQFFSLDQDALRCPYSYYARLRSESPVRPVKYWQTRLSWKAMAWRCPIACAEAGSRNLFCRVADTTGPRSRYGEEFDGREPVCSRSTRLSAFQSARKSAACSSKTATGSLRCSASASAPW